jgi:hypothetical protein
VQLQIADSVDVTACRLATEKGINAIRGRIGATANDLMQGVTIQVGPGLTESGGETFVAERRIVLDAEKAAMSLRDVEALLVLKGYYAVYDLVSLLPNEADQPWSYTIYNIVHELGHLLKGEAAPELSPTKYGRRKEGEAVPELFAYYIFGAQLPSAAEAAIVQVLQNNALMSWGR